MSLRRFALPLDPTDRVDLTLPPKYPDETRTYKLDASAITTDAGKVIRDARVEIDQALTGSGLLNTATGVTFTLAGGEAGNTYPIKLSIWIGNSDREDFELLQPVIVMPVDFPDGSEQVPPDQIPPEIPPYNFVVAVNGRSGYVTLTTADVPGVETLDHKGQASGYAPLDANSLVPSAFLPVPPVISVAGKTGAIMLNADDISGVEKLSRYGQPGGYAPLDLNGKISPAYTYNSSLVTSVNGRVGDVVISATELIGVELTANKGAPLGYPPLDGAGVVPVIYLPPAPVLSVAGKMGNVTLVYTDVIGVETTLMKGIAGGYAPLDGAGLVPSINLPAVLVTSVAGRTGDVLLTTADVHWAESTDNRGAPNGYAPLDADSKVPADFLPTPAASPVTSVAGRTGDIVLAVDDVSGAEAAANKGAADGYAPLNHDGKVPTSFLPPAAAGTGNIIGPSISTVGNFPTWSTADGTELADSVYSATSFLHTASNLSDLASPSAARTSLGVAYGTAAGTVVQGNDSRITGAEQTANKGVAGGYAPLDGAGLVPSANLPSASIPVTSVAGKTGAVTLVPSDISGVEVTSNKGAASGYAPLDASSKVPSANLPTPPVLSVAGKTGAVTLVVADVSGAEAAANKGVAGGYAPLDSVGLVPTANLPAFATSPVSSVAGRTGDVVLAVADVSGAAPLASPALTNPTATTPSTSDNSTKIATTAYVRAQGYITTGSFLVPSNNLSDLISLPTARINLGLGDLATLGYGSSLVSDGANLTVNFGTLAGTAAEGNDSRITGSLKASQNLSDLSSITAARSALSLGSADSPTFAALTLSGASALQLSSGTTAQRPTNNAGLLRWSLTSSHIEVADGSAWKTISDLAYATVGSGLSLSGGVLTASGGGGSGDVVGPSSATDGHFAFFDGATGKLIKDGGAVGALSALGVGTGLASSGGNLTLANSTNNTIRSNVSGGSAAPSDNTLSAILDAVVSSSRGSIIYRGASAWAALAAGTNGQVLTTAGSGADPSWTTVSGGSSSFLNGPEVMAAGWVASRYYGPEYSGPSANAGVQYNALYAMPIFIPNSISLKTLTYNVTSAPGAAQNARMGIYTMSSSTNYPSSLVANSDTGSVTSGTTTGAKTSATLNSGSGVTLSAGWYWVAFLAQGALNVSCVHNNNVYAGWMRKVFGQAALTNLFDYPTVGVQQTSAQSYGSLPSTFGACTDINGWSNAVPIVVLGT